jgi:glucokinase
MTDIYLGLDLGGSYLKYGYGNLNEGLISFSRKAIQQPPNRAVLFRLISEIIETTINTLPAHHRIKAIALGSPGSINPISGEVIGNAPNLRDWSGANPKLILEKQFQLPVFIENDANLMAFGESQIPANRNKSLLGITIGTGIGSGFIVNNSIYYGSNYAGMELGHTSIVPNGRMCNCGKKGCLEAYSSVKNILNEVVFLKLLPEHSELEDVLYVADKFSKVKEVIFSAYDKLGMAIANTATLLDPELVVIGGGITECSSFQLKPLALSINGYLNDYQAKSIAIKKAVMGNKAAVFGGIALAEKRLKLL